MPNSPLLFRRGVGGEVSFIIHSAARSPPAPAQPAPAPKPADNPDDTGHPKIVFLGDSLSAGTGVKPQEAFPALVQEKIRERGLPFEVVNAGVGGDTTAGGLRRLDWLLQRPIDVLVLELGGNDGLRGLPVSNLKSNLQAMIDKAKAKNPAVKIVVAGMQMPPNVGAKYADEFRAVYAEVTPVRLPPAERECTTRMPALRS